MCLLFTKVSSCFPSNLRVLDWYHTYQIGQQKVLAAAGLTSPSTPSTQIFSCRSRALLSEALSLLFAPLRIFSQKQSNILTHRYRINCARHAVRRGSFPHWKTHWFWSKASSTPRQSSPALPSGFPATFGGLFRTWGGSSSLPFGSLLKIRCPKEYPKGSRSCCTWTLSRRLAFPLALEVLLECRKCWGWRCPCWSSQPTGLWFPPFFLAGFRSSQSFSGSPDSIETLWAG